MSRHDRHCEEASARAFPSSSETVPVDLVRRLILEAIKTERARAAALEWETWSRCFGEDAPTAEQAKREMILRAASARALLAFLNKPST